MAPPAEGPLKEYVPLEEKVELVTVSAPAA
jgi:hypothetical protein